MDTQTIINKIKDGKVRYKVGDNVICFRRKSKGYPRGIEDDIEYTIKSIINDVLIVSYNSLYRKDLFSAAEMDQKVHKTYMISKADLREIKINEILR